MIIVDTGPLVAAANRRNDQHGLSVKALTDAALPRLVPSLVIAEVGYFLAEHTGSAAEASFLRSFGTGSEPSCWPAS